MEENSELEEGEAGSYNDNEDKNVNLDIDFSYIDEKMHNVLGHFQKDFEGCVITENLGAKFGEYGSFLPTWVRTPHPKTLHRRSNTPKSPNKFSVEDTSKRLQALSSLPPSKKHIGNSLNNSEVIKRDISSRQNCGVSSPLSAQKSDLQDGKSGPLPDNKVLKFRLKVGSDCMAKKSALICSGLGLDNSPSSSLGNNIKGYGGEQPHNVAHHSPTSILQIMTTFPVPGDLLLSPLDDSLLCLIGKQIMHQDSESGPYHKAVQGHSAVFSNGAVSSLSHSKVSKHTERKYHKKSERAAGSEQGNDAKFKNGTRFSLKKNLHSDNTVVIDTLPDNFKSKPFVNKVSSSDSVKACETASKVAKKANSKPAKNNLFSSTLVENSLEATSGQNNCENEKNHAESSSFVKGLVYPVVSIDNHVVKPSVCGRRKSNRTSEPSKLHSSKIKCMEDFDVGSTTPAEPNIGQQTMLHLQDMATLSSEEEQPLAKGKKNLPDVESVEKKVATSTKQNLRVGVVMGSKDATNTVDGVSSSRHKMLKLKSRNDVCKSRDNHKDSAEGKSVRASGGGATGPAFDGSKVKVRVGRRSVAEYLAEMPVKDAVQVDPLVAENALAIADEWVFCETCEKWRRLPYEINPDDLPDKWLCSMQYWLPGMNRCDISVEETDKAFYALYQLPPYGTSSGVTSENIQRFDQNYWTVNFHDESSRRRKKHGFKDVEKSSSRCALIQTSNFTNNQLLEPVKSRNLIDRNQLYADSNLRRRRNFDNLRKSRRLAAVQPVPDHKENHLNEADMEQVKILTKREVSHLGFGTSDKKIKTENMSYDNKRQDSDMDVGDGDAKSRGGFSAKASEKNVGEFNEYSFADDMKSDNKEIPLVKFEQQAQLSSDGGSLDMRTGDGTSMRKRKSDWLGNQNGHVSNTHAESGATGSKRGKKLSVPKSFAKESSRNDSVHKSKRNSSVARNLITSSDAQPVDGKLVLKIVDKNRQSWKHRKELVSHTLDGSDSLRNDLGSGQISASATSTLSKVSGPVKTRGISDNVKASPVESVSSSPLRTPLERLTLMGMDISGKDNTMISGPPFVGEPRECWDVGVDSKINQSGTGLVNKEKVCGGSDYESPNFFPLDYRDRDADHKHDGRTKSCLVKCETEIMEHNQLPSDSLATMGSYDEDWAEKRHEKVLSLQNTGNSLQDNGKTSTLDLDRDKMKVSGHLSEQGGFSSKENARHNSEFDPKSFTPVDKKVNTKQPAPDNSAIKSSEYKNQHVLKNDSIGHCSKDDGIQNQLKPEECSDSNANKLNATKGESNCATPNLNSHFEGGDKKYSQNHKFMSGSWPGGTFDGRLAYTCSTRDASAKPHGNAALKNGPHQVSGHHVSELKGAKDLCGQGPGKLSSSSVNVAHVLKEAKKLQDLADSFKSKGFGFESNESYFQAAMKYLSGASLLEICNSESAKHGEMSQMQVYSMTAKLCEGCAQEYERRHEMAAAALAYKCMEVAYWRLVSCKSSSSSRNRNELLSSLQIIPQGESPSSSASDVDNLNNQTSVDKTNLSKDSVSHVSGNPISVARNISSVLQLFDFTQDVDFALEASRKSQNAFLAAKSVFDEAKHKECVTSVKKAIDFSFCDVDEFIHLVRLAMEAINRSGFGGSRN